jgi:excisionase family DNA binding protein
MAKKNTIPASDRVGLSRMEAAEYIGVSSGLFDAMVADGRMPAPKIINSRRVWPRRALEKAFDDLPEANQNQQAESPWRDFRV